MMNKKDNRGGARPTAGRKSAEEKGFEKRKQYPLTIPPGVYNEFHTRYGRSWARRVEELMRQDLAENPL